MPENDFVQGVFWNNFPCKTPKHLRMLDRQVKKTHLRDAKYPYVIFTGTTTINLDFIVNNKKLTKGLKKAGGLHIYLYEPTSLYTEDGFTHQYYSEFHNKFNRSVGASELDNIREFVEATDLEVIVHTCDFTSNGILQEMYPEFKVICDDFFIRATNSVLQSIIHKNIKKKFWCSNGRYTVHRHLVMSYLADKPGNYSWHFTCNDIDQVFESANWVEDPLPFDALREGNDALNKTHFSLDGTPKRLEIKKPTDFYLPNHNFMNNADYLDSYYPCFCAIINETRFAQPFANISEKTLDAISAKMPFVLVAPPESLEYVRRLGFKTFSQFWDESYDLEQNHSKRMKMVFDIIDKINSKSIDELKEMYSSMERIINYNYKRAKMFHKSQTTLPS